MTWPQRIWWLSIYLSLLALCIRATEVSTEATSTTQKPTEGSGNDNFEVIDVAQTNKNINQVQTGQTTRIFTNGDVNDDFWLKHLGEDFKYAIHLQVGDSDQYDGIYNMTEDGSNYDIQQDYRIKEIPVDGGNEGGKTQNTQNTSQTQTQIQTQNDKIATQNTKTNDKRTETEQEYNINKNDRTNNDNHENSIIEEQTKKHTDNEYEQIYTVAEDGQSLIKTLRSRKILNEKDTKIPKIQNINIKLTQKQKTEQNKDTNEPKEGFSTSTTWKTSSTPIVVTLPNDDKAIHHLADENSPVVVKMPPVIYHHSPHYAQLTPETLMNTPTQHLHQNSNIQHHNQYTTPTLQQHQQQHQQQHYENTDFTQYNSITSTQNSLIPSISSSSQQQQQQQPYYAPSLIENPTNFNEDSVFGGQGGATINALTNPNTKEQLQKTSGSIRFILRKPSAPYNGSPTHNQIPLENSF